MNDNSDDKAKEKLQEYEDFISKENFELNSNFAVKVMQAVEKDLQPNFLRRLYMNLTMNKKIIASASIICICFLFAYNAKEKDVIMTDNLLIKSKTTSLPISKKANEPNAKTEITEEDKDITNSTLNLPPVANRQEPLKTEVRKSFEQKNNIAGKSKSTGSIATSTAISRTQLMEGESMQAEAADNFAYPKKQTDRLRPYGGMAPKPLDYVKTSRDKFINYQEQGRILTSENGTSTFSIDVDTGSYTFSRKKLALGQRPDKDAVRIEEFLNYFDYNYPKQTEKPFSLYYEIAPAAFDNGRHLVMLGLNTREVRAERKPWNLTFLIDTSGSMNGADRLGLVKRSLTYLVDNMKSEDKVSIVTYAGSAGILLEGTGVVEKEKITDAIKSLGSGGSTYGSAGINLAYEINKKSMLKNGVNRVVIATDGDFNVGISSHVELIKLIEEKRKSGISISAIGVGSGNYNDAMLEQIANKGNGNYFYIDSFTEARNVFGKKLAGNMEIVAKDVKVQIEFNPEHVLQYRLIGYDNRKLKNEDFTNDKVDAGEIGVGHSVTALYEVVFRDSELKNKISGNERYGNVEIKNIKAHSNEFAFLKVRYKEPKESKSKLISFPLLAKKRQNSLSTASKDFSFASAVYYFASSLKNSKYAPNVKNSDIVKLAEDTHRDQANRKEFIEMMKNL